MRKNCINAFLVEKHLAVSKKCGTFAAEKGKSISKFHPFWFGLLIVIVTNVLVFN